MKIVLISNSYWNFYNFRYSLIKKLSVDNEIILIAPKDKYYKNFNKIKCKLIFKNFKTNKINVIYDLIFFFNIFFTLLKLKPDYIINYTIKPVIFVSLISYLTKYKIINIITGFGTMYLKNKFYRKIFNFLYLISQKKINKIIFQNEDDKKYFVEKKLVDKKKCFIIPGSGVDTNLYKSKNFPNFKKTNFLFLGRLLKEKGIIELIDGFNILSKNNKNILLTIVVKDSKNNPSNLVSYLSNFKINKSIKFVFDPPDVRPFIENSHCLVLPSYREGLSKSCLEAMSMERPILVSNVPGCKQLVEENKNGLIFDSINKNSIYQILEKFINLDNNMKIKMGQHSRQIILTKYSMDIIVDKYIDLIKKC